MAFDFGAALTSAGQIAPAWQDAQDIRAQRAIASQKALDEQRLRALQLRSGQQDIQLAQSRESRLSDQERRLNQPVPFGEPHRDSEGKYFTYAMDPSKGIVRLPLEGYDPLGEDQTNIASKKKMYEGILGRPLNPQEQDALLGLKVPTTANQKPQMKQGADGSFRWVYPPDPNTGEVRTAPVLVDGKPYMGKTAPDVTTSYGTRTFQDANGNTFEIPDVRTTVRGNGGSHAGAGPKVPRGTTPAAVPAISALTGAQNPSSPVPGARFLGKTKLSAQDKGTLETDQQLIPVMQGALKDIEAQGLTKANSITDKGKMLLAWEQYKHGFAPTSPEGASLQQVAAIGIMGAAPWMRLGRNRYTFQVIQQHLPQPTDTPALAYSKIKWMNDHLIPESMGVITGNAPKTQQYNAGDKVMYKGRPATIKQVYPDGSYAVDVE